MSEPPQAKLHAQVHAECKRELGSQTDRGAAILGATFLEVRLEEAIRSRLVGSGDPVESLFRGGAALGTFSAKTDMAFALGFYGPKVHRDLTLIGRIRDRFARDLGAVSFASSDVATQCGELWFPRNVRGYGEESGPKEPRGQFVFTVLLIFNLLVTEMRDNMPELRTSRFFST